MENFFGNFDYLLRGAWVTLGISVVSIVMGSLLGAATCVGMLLGPAAMGRVLEWWVTCVRGVPVLVLMFIAYFAAPELGFDVSGLVSVTLSLSVYVSAFYAESMRGCITAIPRGQVEAGAAIGMTRWRVLKHILLPQAVTLMVAPWLATSVIAVKSTAYASIVGVWELTMASREVVERTIDPFPVFFGAMLMYFAVCFPLSLVARNASARHDGTQTR